MFDALPLLITDRSAVQFSSISRTRKMTQCQLQPTRDFRKCGVGGVALNSPGKYWYSQQSELKAVCRQVQSQYVRTRLLNVPNQGALVQVSAAPAVLVGRQQSYANIISCFVCTPFDFNQTPCIHTSKPRLHRRVKQIAA